MDRLRKFYQTSAYRYVFWILLIFLLVLANWALRNGDHLLLLGVASVGVVLGAGSIYVERINFNRGESFEPAYTTRVIRSVALLAVSLGLAALSIILMLGIYDG
ncbi:MAG: hypothetical protein AB1Z18_11670 [Desulfobacterales bacterium]|jgi:hypothetical protein